MKIIGVEFYVRPHDGVVLVYKVFHNVDDAGRIQFTGRYKIGASTYFTSLDTAQRYALRHLQHVHEPGEWMFVGVLRRQGGHSFPYGITADTVGILSYPVRRSMGGYDGHKHTLHRVRITSLDIPALT